MAAGGASCAFQYLAGVEVAPYTARSWSAMTSGALRSRAAASARSPASASRHRACEARRRARRRRPAGYSPSSGTASVRPPDAAATVGSAGRHRLQRREREDLGVAARARPRRPRAACSARSSAGATWPTNVACPWASSSALCGPSPAITSGRLTARHASRTSANPFSGVSRPAASTNSPSAAVERVGELALDRAEHARLVVRAARRGRCSRCSANALGTTISSATPVSRRCCSASPAA